VSVPDPVAWDGDDPRLDAVRDGLAGAGVGWAAVLVVLGRWRPLAALWLPLPPGGDGTLVAGYLALVAGPFGIVSLRHVFVA
jgi:hypothetical protein